MGAETKFNIYFYLPVSGGNGKTLDCRDTTELLTDIYVPKDLKIPQEQGENQFYLLNKTRKEMTEIWEKPYIGGLELVYP